MPSNYTCYHSFSTGCGPSLAIFVPYPIEALLNLHHARHLLASCLTSYEFLLLTAPYVTLVHCYSLSSATLPRSSTDEIPPDCLTLIDQLLSLCDDLHETPW